MSEVVVATSATGELPAASENPTWSRPFLQRTVIGPIFHTIAHTIYDTVEDEIRRENSDDWQVSNLIELKDAVSRLMDMALKTPLAQEYDEDYDSSPLADFLARHRIFKDGKPGATEDLVTIPFHTLVREGIHSGLAVPLQVYYMRLLRRSTKTPVFLDLTCGNHADVSIDPLASAEEIESEAFMKDLHTFAYTSNGVLGSSSTTSHLFNGGMLDAFLANGATGVYRYEEEISKYYDRDEKTGVMSLAEPAKTFLRAKLVEHNRQHGSGAQTGGCPVRHSTFKRVGECASQFISEHSPTGQLEHKGTSAITRGAQLLAFALRYEP